MGATESKEKHSGIKELLPDIDCLLVDHEETGRTVPDGDAFERKRQSAATVFSDDLTKKKWINQPSSSSDKEEKEAPTSDDKEQKKSGMAADAKRGKLQVTADNQTSEIEADKTRALPSAIATDENKSSGRRVGTHNAALECLKLMRQTQQWPKTTVAMNHFLQTKRTPLLAQWIQDCKDASKKNQRKHTKILTNMLIKLKCVTKVGSAYTWNPSTVNRILDPVPSTASAQSPDNNNSSAGVLLVGTDTEVAQSPDTNNNTDVPDSTEVLLVEKIGQLDELLATPPFEQLRSQSTRLEQQASSALVCDGDTVEKNFFILQQEALHNTRSNGSLTMMAVDCEGVPENLYLIQVGTPEATYVFDCVKLGAKAVCDFLSPILEDESITKLFHDLHNDVVALSRLGGVDTIRGAFDTQLAAEILTGRFHVGFNDMLETIGLQPHPTKHSMKKRMEGGKLFAQRPLPRDVLKYAADDVKLLANARETLEAELGELWDVVQRASDTRAQQARMSGGKREICFDVNNHFAIASFELLKKLRPDDMLIPVPLHVSNEACTLVSLLPPDIAVGLSGLTAALSDIVLDKGRTPLAWIAGKRCLLGGADRLVKSSEIDSIVEQLGGFGSDNRAGLERQLHRISAFRNRELDIIGLTMRVGRHVSGNASIISDLLFAETPLSLLFLGVPGSGKTTVVREVTRLLAEQANVCIVDTSNEIAGDGDVPHPCVGFARRMMVPSLDKQSAVMVECLQNHTPAVMVIDEIGRSTEVETARTIKNRGVRLVASAHGDLRKLIKNPKLRGLVGGVESVTLGDMAAKFEAKRKNYAKGVLSKVKVERAGPPIFDAIIELKPGNHHTWRVIPNTANAVDRVLDGEQFLAQKRTRDPTTGATKLQFERA